MKKITIIIILNILLSSCATNNNNDSFYNNITVSCNLKNKQITLNYCYKN